MNILNIEHVSKIFGEKKIFDDVSYGIHEGDKIGIIGINGTGKTTLLKMIAGLEETDEGHIIKQNGLHITYLPQNPEFPEGATILNYVTQDKEYEANILSYMSNQLLGIGNTAASIDELYLFLTNMTAIEYIRNAMKRVRKKDSSIILASQNIEDFLIPEIREFTKPLFSIPTHQFLFNAGQINPKEYMDALQVEPSEFELIKYPERGTCLYRCGNERYLLQVIAPDYKTAIFGTAGGR